jgi:hypothetical protein
MIGTPAVTVLINGALVDGSADARLEGDVVVAPMAPYLRSIADRIETGDGGGRIVFERAGRVVTIVIGSPVIRSGDATEALPIAPYVRAGEALIPLAAVARALGASVDYNGATRTINVATVPAPLVSMTPDMAYRPPAEPLETFTPQPTPAPPVVATGTPRPRRTPIVVENARPSVTAPP